MINRRIENIEDDELTRILNMVFEVNILRQIQMKSQTGYIKAPNKFYFFIYSLLKLFFVNWKGEFINLYSLGTEW